MQKIDIKSMPLTALEIMMKKLGQAKYRTDQIYTWLHRYHVRSFSEMTNLPKALRELLGEKCYINSLEVEKTQVSKVDGTIKYLLRLMDGNCIEVVFMQYNHGASLCISTQVGCRMGCSFCASTIGGLVRNLTASEILDQIYLIEDLSGNTISNVVLMGIGEPLDNFDNVTDMLAILASPDGRNFSLRSVTLSTCGLVDKIDQLSARQIPITLSISLHAPNDDARSAIMPINKHWDIKHLLDACERYFRTTGRRITFEYALIDGENDTVEEAIQLAKLLTTPQMYSLNSHVNLIPVNPVTERKFKRSRKENVLQFQKILTGHGINATIRRELGSDISAACGQLRRENSMPSLD